MFYLFIENFLSKEECENIIKITSSKELKRLTSVKLSDSGFKPNQYEDDLHRRSGAMYNYIEIQKIPELKIVSDKSINYLNQSPPYKNTKYTGIPKFTFNRYQDGDYLNYHPDKHEIEFGATITIIYQLNDNYVGGEVTYMIDKKEYIVPKKQGSIFIFDSEMLHSVKKVEGGIRYSMNSWPSTLMDYSKKSLL